MAQGALMDASDLEAVISRLYLQSTYTEYLTVSMSIQEADPARAPGRRTRQAELYL